ncbi:unnamed protein product [Mucor hiemalis]
MAIIKRQEDSVGEATTPTYVVSLPPSFAPLPSKTVPAENEATNTFTVPSFAPITKPTDTPNPTVKADTPQLPSFSPLASREPVSVSTPVWPTSTPTSLPLEVQERESQGLSGGIIAGIVIGAIAGLCLLIYMAYVLWWSRRKIVKKSKHKKSSEGDVEGEKPNREILTKNNKNSNNVVNASLPTEVLDRELFTKSKERDYMSVVTNAPSALPRLAGRYDPDRVYSPTSPTSDLKEDFRSYYRARGSFQSGSNGSSGSSSADSGTPLFGGRSPMYGGSTPYYGPLIQQQSPAVFPQGNFNLPMYAPQFIPPHMYSRDYYQQPAFRPSTPSDQSEK